VVLGAALLNFLTIGWEGVSLGPLIYLPLVLVLPTPWAILAAVGSMAVTMAVNGHPFALVIAAVEAIWLVLGSRRSVRAPVVRDLLFWLLAGAPLVMMFHYGAAGVSAGVATTIWFKSFVVHFVAVAIAAVLIQQTPLRHWLTGERFVPTRLRQAFLQFTFLIVVLTFIVAVGGLLILLRKQNEPSDRFSLREVAQRAAGQFRSLADERRRMAVSVANAVARDPAATVELLNAEWAKDREISWLRVDADGYVRTIATEDPSAFARVEALMDQPFFTGPRDSGAGSVAGWSFGEDAALAISTSMVDSQGGFDGVIIQVLNAKVVGRALVGVLADSGVSLNVVDVGGRILYKSGAQQGGFLSRSSFESARSALFLDEIGNGYTQWERVDAGGQIEHLGAWRVKVDSGFVVIAHRSGQPVWFMLKAEFGALLMALLVISGVAIVALFTAYRRVAVPLEQFEQVAGFQAQMSAHAPIENPAPNAPREISAVFEAFGNLVEELHKAQALVLRSNAELDVRVKKVTEEAQVACQHAEKAWGRAEAASQAKSDFLARTTHEIRTPLNAIIGLAEAVADTSSDPVVRKRIQTIRTSGLGLLGMVNDLLDLSRIEARKLELNVGPVEIGQVGENIHSLFGLGAEQKGLRLLVEVSPPAVHWLELDGARLNQVLVNLVGNALKFTRTGRVRLRLAVRYRPEGDVDLRCSVVDTGPGIAPEQQANLFQPYVQLPGASAMGGSGLGLTISHELVSLFGGELSVLSQPGHGSEFYFTLRTRRSVPVPVASVRLAEKSKESDRLRVLAVDDNVVNQEILRNVLERDYPQLKIVASASAALDALARESFDIALVDLEMPEADGHYVARTVRGWRGAEASRGCRLVAFSAYAREQIWTRCQESGFDDYVGKPIDRLHLVRVLGGKVKAERREAVQF
jgi:signal transduction histidine kinase/CheY-like chemotaxis protein